MAPSSALSQRDRQLPGDEQFGRQFAQFVGVADAPSYRRRGLAHLTRLAGRPLLSITRTASLLDRSGQSRLGVVGQSSYTSASRCNS